MYVHAVAIHVGTMGYACQRKRQALYVNVPKVLLEGCARTDDQHVIQIHV